MAGALGLPVMQRRDYYGTAAEKNMLNLVMNTNSTYRSSAYGVSLSSSGRSSAIVKLTGDFRGTSDGGLQGLFVRLTNSGAMDMAYKGIQAVKGVGYNTAHITAGVIYGGMFVAVHTHASNHMHAEASLIGLEGWAYDADGPVATMLGGNIGYHNEEAGAQVGGSVHRALQIFCDDSAGSNADESTGICLWNMSGTQDAALRAVHSGSGFTYFLNCPTVSGFAAVKSGTYAGSGNTAKIAMNIGGTPYYFIGHATVS